MLIKIDNDTFADVFDPLYKDVFSETETQGRVADLQKKIAELEKQRLSMPEKPSEAMFEAVNEHNLKHTDGEINRLSAELDKLTKLLNDMENAE